MVRVLVYLAAIIGNTYFVLETSAPLLVIVPALGSLVWFLGLKPAWPALIAPPAILVLGGGLYGAMLALGADCPVQGMDYLDQCNTRAGVALMAMFMTPFAFVLSLLALAGAAALRSFIWAGRAWSLRHGLETRAPAATEARSPAPSPRW